MKTIILLILVTANISHAQRSGGSEGTGGGDSCEQRIQEIRDDLMNWISKGGHKNLKNLPVSAEEYSKRMAAYLYVERRSSGVYKPVTRIKCVSGSIEVQGVEKFCRFDRLTSGPQITCSAAAFLNKNIMGPDEQYKIIHHEYAGLAELETPDGAASQYALSNQISSLLVDQVVKRLAVKPQSQVGYSAIYTNADGSVTLDNPFLIFRGKPILIAVTSSDNGDDRASASGICALLGKKLVNAEPISE